MSSAAVPLSDWLARLETLSPREIDLGLLRVRTVLERLDLPLPAHVITIAGTNGKGSCVAMAEALLRGNGFSTGAYTSPHILEYNERIAVNGDAASDAEIIAAFERVEAARHGAELTYFEYGTLAAMVVFAAAKLDVWILEVGLGGRLDAVNAIDASAALITNISLDHCDWLGPDVATIAVEKAGVMRSGKPVVFGDANMPDAILVQADTIGANLLRSGKDFHFEITEEGTWSWHGPTVELQGLLPPGLQGKFQIANAAAVLALLDAAGLLANIDAARVNGILPDTSLRGRLQHLYIGDVAWLLDVAHNPAAAEKLAETLSTMDVQARLTAIVGVLDDKDLDGIILPLVPLVDRWIAVEADSPRAVPVSELSRQIANLGNKPCRIATSAPDAIEFARRNASENDRILVTGSFFTVGPILDHLLAETDPLHLTST